MFGICRREGASHLIGSRALKLLFDANLSLQLVTDFIDLFPKSADVFDYSLGSNDGKIWDFAKDHGFSIVSKDADFFNLSIVRGAPPKVIWVRAGNANTRLISELLRANTLILQSFFADLDEAICIIGAKS